MNVYSITWDMETLAVIYRIPSGYMGRCDLCKGGESKATEAIAQQQVNRANYASEQQNALMRQQLSQQQGQLDMVNPVIQKIIANGGMSPDAESALRSIAMNTLPQTYNNLYGQLNNQLVQRGITGGANAGSGDIARGFGSIASSEAGQQANLLSQIPLQKEQGLYNALNTSLGIGGMYGQNVGMFNQGGLAGLGAANSALGIRQAAAGQADASAGGFFGSLIGAGLGLVKPR